MSRRNGICRCGNGISSVKWKSFEGKLDYYVCSAYKSGRGECACHCIQEGVLRHRRQTAQIIFNFVVQIEIPILTGPIPLETPKTKKNCVVTPTAQLPQGSVPYERKPILFKGLQIILAS